MRIVGFTYEAAFHCVDCGYEYFPQLLDEKCVDREGNEVGGVFNFDEFEYDQHCDDCGCLIIKGYLAIDKECNYENV